MKIDLYAVGKAPSYIHRTKQKYQLPLFTTKFHNKSTTRESNGKTI